MLERDPTTGPRPGNTPGSAPRPHEVPIAGLLRDSIVGITCFPDPLPRRARRGPRRRRRGRGALARAARTSGLGRG
jgi:hypothetical protein